MSNRKERRFIRMDDKKMDQLLHDMKDDYEKMPEYVDKGTVMNQVFNNKQKFIWKALPAIAIVAGLFLFIVITLPYLDLEQQANENSLTLEKYFLKEKEAFREDLGLKSVDNFNAVERAEKVVEDIGSSKDPEVIDQGKKEINNSFQTPKKMVEDINKNKQPNSDEAMQELLKLMQITRRSIEEYLSQLQLDREIDFSKQEAILNAQDAVDRYAGPREIEMFLEMLKEQGYLLMRNKEFDYLQVKIDYHWLIQHIKSWEGNEGYKQFFELMATSAIDPINPGMQNDYGMPWTEFDNVLLEVEALYNKYRHRSPFYTRRIIYIAEVYLNDYLSGGVKPGEQLNAEAQHELEKFVAEHKDSRYWGIVNQTITKYKENGWVRSGQNEFGVLDILFSEKFRMVNYKDIVYINRWPVDKSTFDLYQEYKIKYDIHY